MRRTAKCMVQIPQPIQYLLATWKFAHRNYFDECCGQANGSVCVRVRTRCAQNRFHPRKFLYLHRVLNCVRTNGILLAMYVVMVWYGSINGSTNDHRYALQKWIRTSGHVWHVYFLCIEWVEMNAKGIKPIEMWVLAWSVLHVSAFLRIFMHRQDE